MFEVYHTEKSDESTVAHQRSISKIKKPVKAPV
jgi:hypothetical protein